MHFMLILFLIDFKAESNSLFNSMLVHTFLKRIFIQISTSFLNLIFQKKIQIFGSLTIEILAVIFKN